MQVERPHPVHLDDRLALGNGEVPLFLPEPNVRPGWQVADLVPFQPVTQAEAEGPADDGQVLLDRLPLQWDDRPACELGADGKRPVLGRFAVEDDHLSARRECRRGRTPFDIVGQGDHVRQLGGRRTARARRVIRADGKGQDAGGQGGQESWAHFILRGLAAGAASRPGYGPSGTGPRRREMPGTPPAGSGKWYTGPSCRESNNFRGRAAGTAGKSNPGCPGARVGRESPTPPAVRGRRRPRTQRREMSGNKRRIRRIHSWASGCSRSPLNGSARSRITITESRPAFVRSSRCLWCRCGCCWITRPRTTTAWPPSTSTTWNRSRPSWRPPRNSTPPSSSRRAAGPGATPRTRTCAT